MNLSLIETELKKRHRHPYHWGRKQNDSWDNHTNYIYEINTFDEMISRSESVFLTLDSQVFSRQDFFNYAANRWYNFHSAKAIESIFCYHPIVKAAKDDRDREKDFFIQSIPFDHKTSVFPKNYKAGLNGALNDKKDFIQWLYHKQSKGKRLHLENRLFLVVYACDGEHWKLKAELLWLEKIVESYLEKFSPDSLCKLYLKSDGSQTLSDIIWAIR